MDYFEIDRDLSQRQRWWLDTPKSIGRNIDVRAFSSGRRLTFDSELIVPIGKAGDGMDITFSHYFIPYINSRVGALFEAFASWDIQRIPAKYETGENIEILNVLTVLDAFDHQRSEATYKRNKPNMVMKLRIKADNAQGHHVFRLNEWRGPLIISELILEQLQRIGARGFVAEKVS